MGKKGSVFKGFEVDAECIPFPQVCWNVDGIFLSCGQSPCIYYDYHVEKTVNFQNAGPQA